MLGKLTLCQLSYSRSGDSEVAIGRRCRYLGCWRGRDRRWHRRWHGGEVMVERAKLVTMDYHRPVRPRSGQVLTVETTCTCASIIRSRGRASERQCVIDAVDAAHPIDAIGLGIPVRPPSLPSSAGNEVQVFARGADGRLTALGAALTGGLGSGSGLGSQGAVVLDEGGRWLLAVDPGSDEVTSFRVRPGGEITWADRIASGGDLPISVTIHDGVVYALNAGGTGNIAGFRLAGDGSLSPIPGSIRPLSSGASGPAQISFSLVLTATNSL
jgi:hypothetical protein